MDDTQKVEYLKMVIKNLGESMTNLQLENAEIKTQLEILKMQQEGNPDDNE